MPSDKPIFFKPGDFGTLPWLTSTENIRQTCADTANTKVAPLLQAMEIMRIQIGWIIAAYDVYETFDSKLVYEKLKETQAKCDEILK